ncbi:1043_t:CDS:2, partial [Paraglomus occultum]
MHIHIQDPQTDRARTRIEWGGQCLLKYTYAIIEGVVEGDFGDGSILQRRARYGPEGYVCSDWWYTIALYCPTAHSRDFRTRSQIELEWTTYCQELSAVIWSSGKEM